MIRKTILASFAVLLFCIASLTFMAAGKTDVADAAMKGDKAKVIVPEKGKAFAV